MDDFYVELDKRVPLFFRAMELEEEQMEGQAEDGQSDGDDSALTFYLKELDLANGPPKATPKLSDRTRKNWEDGRHYIKYAAHKSWAFDPVFGKYTDQRFF